MLHFCDVALLWCSVCWWNAVRAAEHLHIYSRGSVWCGLRRCLSTAQAEPNTTVPGVECILYLYFIYIYLFIFKCCWVLFLETMLWSFIVWNFNSIKNSAEYFFYFFLYMCTLLVRLYFGKKVLFFLMFLFWEFESGLNWPPPHPTPTHPPAPKQLKAVIMVRMLKSSKPLWSWCHLRSW